MIGMGNHDSPLFILNQYNIKYITKYCTVYKNLALFDK